MTAFDRVLLVIVRYGLFAVLFLPFVVVLAYLYPWVSGKIWGFEIIVEMLFPLYVLLALRRKEYRPAANPLLYAVLIYFAVATLSMLLGAHPHRSFWSKPDRLTGLFFQYHLLAFFLIAGSVWRGVLQRPIIATVGIATIVSLQALFQAVFGKSDDGGLSRAMASFGNPSYLGQYLVPHLFLSGWLIHRHLRSRWRLLWVASAVLIFFGIFLTKSKGALLGLLAGALIAVVIAAIYGKGRNIRRASIAVFAGAGLLVAAFFIADRVPSTHQWLYDQRLSVQYFKETMGPRRLLLENAIKGFKARPLLGWGPENFESAYYYFYDPATLRYSDYEARQDRPHNLVLEILNNLGIAGFAAYAAIFVLAWKLSLHGRKGRFFEGAVLVIAALSQVSTNLFLFETPMSYVTLFLMLSLIAAFVSPEPESGMDESAQAAVPAAAVAAGASLWAFWYGVAGTIGAAYLTAQLIMMLQPGPQPIDPKKMSEMIAELKTKKTPYLERDLRAITSHLTRGRGGHLSGPGGDILADLAMTEVGYSDRNSNKNDYVHSLVTASALLSLGQRTAEHQALMEDNLARMRRLSPNRQEVFWIDAQIRLEKGDLDGAEEQFRRAVDLNPGIVVAHAEYAAFLMGYKDVGQAVAYVRQYPEILRHGDADPIMQRAVLRLLDENRFADMLELYRASVREDVPSFQWTMLGALSAVTLGQKDEGQRIADEARKAWPDKIELIDRLMEQQLTETGE